MSNWSQGFVGALTQSLGQAQAQLLAAQAKKVERQQLFAKTLLERGLEMGDVESQAAGWTLLLDPKADPANPEKSKEYQRALKIGGLTEAMKAGPMGSEISTPKGPPGAPPVAPGPPPGALAPPPMAGGAPAAMPATSPTTGGPMSLIPGGAAAQGPPAAPGPPAPAPAAPPPTPETPPTNQDHISSWDEGLQKVDDYIRQLGQPNVPEAVRMKEYAKAAELRSTLQAYKAAGIPVTPENIQDVIAGVNPTAARIGATRDLAMLKASQAEKLEQLKQAGRVAIEKAKEAFKKGAAQVELDDEEAKALGLPSAGFVDRDVLKQLESNYRTNIAAGARVRAAEVSGSTKITKVLDPDTQEVVYHVGTSGLEGVAAPPTAATQAKIDQAGRILDLRENLLQAMKKPEVRSKLNRYLAQNSLASLFSSQDPVAVEFMGELESWLSMQPALHGFRAQKAVERFEKITGGPIRSIETLEAAIRGISKASESFVRGAKKPAPPPGASNIKDLKKKYNLPEY